MEWSTTPPSEAGYYWAYENLDPEDAEALAVWMVWGAVCLAGGMAIGVIIGFGLGMKLK